MEYDATNADRLGEKSPDCRLFFFHRGKEGPMLTGRIHSVESMGLVDGPGIRTVIFLQGCRLRCRYCHNPDTWAMESGKAMELQPRELVERLVRFKPYYSAGGGVTFSGGEPLLQPEFLRTALELCREEGIHTCLDTAGCGLGDYQAILRHTDLVLLDVKHYTPQGYRDITGSSMEAFETFRAAVREAGIPLWVRHVVVPGLTDSPGHLAGLEEYLADWPNLERVELLPYHTLGVYKYRALNIPYSLEGVPPMEEEKLKDWTRRLNQRCCRGTHERKEREV